MRKPYYILASLAIMLFIVTSSCANSNSNPAKTASLQPSQGAIAIMNLKSSPLSTQSAQLVATTSPTNDPTDTPKPSPVQKTATVGTYSETPTHTALSATPNCINQAEFVKNLSIGNNTALMPGQYFAKIWQVKNAGSCTWTQEYKLVFMDGNSMNALPSENLPHSVAPGETIDLRLELVAPQEEGSHTGNWMLEDESGNLFGLGQAKDEPLQVIIVVKPTPMPTSGCVKCQPDLNLP
jgi:hypothetical protein